MLATVQVLIVCIVEFFTPGRLVCVFQSLHSGSAHMYVGITQGRQQRVQGSGLPVLGDLPQGTRYRLTDLRLRVDQGRY